MAVESAVDLLANTERVPSILQAHAANEAQKVVIGGRASRALAAAITATVAAVPERRKCEQLRWDQHRWHDNITPWPEYVGPLPTPLRDEADALRGWNGAAHERVALVVGHDK
eukprot:369116-Prymnesium_polylepis.2